MRVLVCLCLALVCTAVIAAEPDFSLLHASVTVLDLITALFAVGVVLVGLLLARLGIRLVIDLVNRPDYSSDGFDPEDYSFHTGGSSTGGRKIDTDDTAF